jgi:cell division protein FtsA
MADVHLGIDIGSTKVAAVLTLSKKVNNTVVCEVVGAAKVRNDGVYKGNIKNPLKTKAAIREALTIAVEKASNPHLTNKSLLASVNVSGVHIEKIPSSITCRSSSVSDDDINNLFKDIQVTYSSQTDEIVHLLPLKFSVGDQHEIIDPVGYTGLKLNGDFNVITANKASIQLIKDALHDTNAALNESDGFAASPLMSGLALLTEPHKQLGVVVVDIGGGTTDVAIYHDGLLQHTAVLPFGGNHITDDIRQGCHLSNDSAEEAKITLSETDPNECSLNQILVIPTAEGIPPIEVVARNVVLIARARLREIAALVLAEVKKAGFDERILRAGIILTGGTTNMKGVEKIFKQVTNMHVQLGTAKGLTRTNAAIHDAVVNDPAFATALGLSLHTVETFFLDKRIRKPDDFVETRQEPKKSGSIWPFGGKEITSFKDAKEVGRTIWRGITKDDIGESDTY